MSDSSKNKIDIQLLLLSTYPGITQVYITLTHNSKIK